MAAAADLGVVQEDGSNPPLAEAVGGEGDGGDGGGGGYSTTWTLSASFS